MPHLEPTYLRYIYDGLVKGSIHPENAAELPDGLIGLYEEAFDERNSVVERQKLLERFAIWALLKKEVSAAFVAEVLGDTEDEIQNFISKYSAWFNSPESGKYQLYHERLKVYLLQKLSDGEVAKLNTLIVDYLVQKVNEAQQSESVTYCFEKLSFHLFLNAYFTGNSDLFAQYCLDDNFKKRQFELSGYYDWEEKMMVLGVEYFSLNQDSICHHIVFEKTKIQFKKKDIDLILSLIRNGDMETVFRFFQNTSETNLYARVEIAYFYFLSFFDIFEKADWNFIQKKERASKLLEIFEDNFQWDNGYYLSQFVDVNISFILHCYFIQFGLDFRKIAVLSSDHKIEYFDLTCGNEGTLKFMRKGHEEEAYFILNKLGLRGDKSFDYSFYLESNVDLTKFLEKFNIDTNNYKDLINSELETKILSIEKRNFFYPDFSEIIENEISDFNILLACLRLRISYLELPLERQKKMLKLLNESFLEESKDKFEIMGYLHRKDLSISFKKNSEIKNVIQLVGENLTIDEFVKFDLKKRYNLLNYKNINCDEDVELMLFFMELSEYYQKEKPKVLDSLLSALLVEFHLNLNFELIDGYIDELLDLISSSIEASEEFENTFFIKLLEFFNRNDVNGQLKKTLNLILESVLEIYLDFSFYNYSFIAGCQLINLFSKYKIDFPEKEIIDRILEDLNYLIEENDHNEMDEIANSAIYKIYEKDYFWDFYNSIKKIQIENVKEHMVKKIFEDIILYKGTNYNTVIFFKDNSTDYPGMYNLAIKRLSKHLSETNQLFSYLPIRQDNDLLLERLLLNIVSNRKRLKEPLNIQILNHYSLEWVMELDNEYEKLISPN